jgi:transcriptional regulator with XRE-family HTH domain
MLNVSATIITFWETGRSVPRLDNCVAIANALGVSIDYLAGRSDA